jgi:hypothetical protein
MKKWTIKIGTWLSVISLSAMLTACFGKFALTRKIYEWNDSFDNKFLKTLLFYGLNIIPVYGIGGAVDFFILNLIEFWTGSNPLSMAPGQKEKQVIWYAGNLYELEAELNKFTATPLTQNGERISLTFNPTEQTVAVQRGETAPTIIAHFIPATNMDELTASTK